MSTKFYFLALAFIFCPFISFGQQKEVDSLEKLLKVAKPDTTRLNLYLALCYACNIKDNLKYSEPAIALADQLLQNTGDEVFRKKILKQKATAYGISRFFYEQQGEEKKALDYRKKQLTIALNIKDTIEIVNNLYALCSYYKATGNFPKALEVLQKGLSLSEAMNYKKGIAGFIGQMGGMYRDQGDTLQAIENYQKSLAILIELNDTLSIASSLIRTGNLYSALRNSTTALGYYNRAMHLYQLKKDKRGIRNIYNIIGVMYMENDDFKNALINFEKSLVLSTELDDKDWDRAILGNIGISHAHLGNTEKALDYQFQSLKLALAINNGVVWAYEHLARTFLKRKDYRSARDYFNRAMALRKNESSIQDLRESELLASRIDSASGNSAGAFEHYKTYISLSNKLKSDEVRKLAAQQRFQLEFDRQKAAAKAEQDKLDLINRNEMKRQKIVRNSFIGAFFFALLLTLILLRNYRQKQKTNLELEKKNNEIEEKNKEITDSITYALRIQQAKLPKKKDISDFLPNNFILFKPKDIVSGDFYFFNKTKKGAFIAAVDCTGHGVPGAFMSLIGFEKLEEVTFNNINPSEILKQLNKGIKTSLRQTDSDDSTRDGMDIALCLVDVENLTVSYAGANRPLWLIRSGETTVEEIKATKKAIGGLTEDDQHFESQELKLSRGDTLYIFTDGYADQFSGTNGKKLMTKKFKEILLEIQSKTMPEQEQYLNTYIEAWKNGIEQVDDILVIGIRL
ncbi:MAG: tetratricopeptide repeat protein [Bacteroidota bacterium]